ncbi:MAG TPA: UDP-N-acetylglucosamine 1-carboxyvinyltransferase [Acidimicrobiales bacterium]|nr:UDP-N-acetylglucosamine 1-carboxyvinyltransferase [Acidimicrobiales bacterium]
MIVRPSSGLRGEVPISGAKNSVLKLMAATLLAPGESVLHNVPAISDVGIMAELLRAMGAEVTLGPGTARIVVPEVCGLEAPYELVERMRASIVVLGPLLGRFGRARVSLPGGDDLGPRPIDMHLSGLQKLGACFESEHGYIEARAEMLRGAEVLLEYPSVGATENLLMAAVLAKGRTLIENAAREPEISDLCDMLTAMGARIEGAGSSTIEVEGVEGLSPVTHSVVPDRIEAATYLAAVGVAGGELTLRGARADHMEMLIEKLRAMGMTISDTGEGLWAMAPETLRSVDVVTLPYPGVATDYKPFLVAMLSVAEGVGIVTENIFQGGRFGYIDELRRMRADIRTQGHHAVVRGTPALSGARVRARDIRAGAALVVAGLRAEGETRVVGVSHIDRGYDGLVPKLAAVGADVSRRQT